MNRARSATIGFAGLGRMGEPMARRIVQSGAALVAFDLVADRPRRIAGAIPAAALGDVAAQAATVILMLPDSEAVEAALFGPEGLAAAMSEGDTLIDMSSSHPDRTIEVGERLKRLGVAMLDAPVSGGVARAETGALAIMAGGDPALFDRHASLLATMGSSISHVGPLGAGHALKALNNLLSAVGLVASAEVLLAGRKWGLDPVLMLGAINSSSGRNNSTENKIAQFVYSGSFASGFGLDLMNKDVQIALDLAASTGSPNITGEVVGRFCKAAGEALGSGADHTEIVRVLEQMAGASLRDEGR
jgi:3-hydroxyisobutyrate dehydrogenase